MQPRLTKNLRHLPLTFVAAAAAALAACASDAGPTNDLPAGFTPLGVTV